MRGLENLKVKGKRKLKLLVYNKAIIVKDQPIFLKSSQDKLITFLKYILFILHFNILYNIILHLCM